MKSRAGRSLAQPLLFAVLACAHTWPLAAHPSVWSRNDNADAMLNEWILAWVAHVIPTAPWRLFDANIFYPEPNTLAFSESLIVQGVMGMPLYWLGASPVLLMNVLILLGLTLTGWAMSHVIERWTGSRRAGILAGSLMAFNTSVLTRMGHVQAMHVEFLPLALLAFDRLLREPTTGVAVRLGLHVALQALCSGYLLVISLIALAGSALARIREWTGRSFVPIARHAALAALTFAIVAGPFLWPYYRAKTTQGLERPLDEVAMYSAQMGDYITTAARFHFDMWSHRYYRGHDGFFPGIIGVALALAALVVPASRRDPRVHALTALGLAGFALSFGPAFPLYPWLHAHVPLLQGLRGVARFGYLPVIAVAGLAGFGLAWLEQRITRRAAAIGITLIVVANLEMARAPMSYTRFDGIPAVYDLLAAEASAVVAEFPFPSPRSADMNGRYVLASTRHWRPLLNGYSGFVPESYVQHSQELATFPDSAAVAALRRIGVTHVVAHIDVAPELEAALTRHPAFTPVAAARGIRIYRLVDESARDRTAEGQRTSKSP